MLACILIPHLVAAVECHGDASLQGSHLVVVKTDEVKRTVYAVSEGAWQTGVNAGMTPQQAQALCPEVYLLEADEGRYQRVFGQLMLLLADFTPAIEAPEDPFRQPVTVCYLDLGKLTKGAAVSLGAKLAAVIEAELGLTVRVGLAEGKFPAFVAAGRAESVLHIARGKEATFLAPYPVTTLPLDAEMTHRLGLLGLRTVGQFAALPRHAVLVQFGWQGQWLHRLAQGEDTRPVKGMLDAREMHLERQFEPPLVDRLVLQSVLHQMVGELAGRLRTEAFACQQVKLSLCFEDGTAQQESFSPRQPVSLAETIEQVVQDGLVQFSAASGIVDVAITLSEFVPMTTRQLDLFSRVDAQGRRLESALRVLLSRYGEHCFYRPVLVESRSAYLPEQRFWLEPVEV